jgi:hypothetical protein
MRGLDRAILIQPGDCDLVRCSYDLIILKSAGCLVQEFRSRIGTLGPTGRPDAMRLDAIRARAPGSRSSSSVTAIPKNRQEANVSEPQPSRLHANIRGSQCHH